jgi:hypothetical protein
MLKFLNLPVDPGYYYDVLSIQQVKFEKGIQGKEVFDFYSDYVRKQVGVGAHKIILESPEYAECVRVNTMTYEGVEDAREDKVKASYVWNRNDDRFVAKTKLQRRFFPDWKGLEKKSVTKAL